MQRIIWHWSAGGHKANATDKKAYHIIIEDGGRIVRGDHAISDNESTSTAYAAHTRGLNTGSIGVALAGMRGAKERPFDPGPSPITEAQIEVLIDQTASLCRQYNIPVTRETVLSHAEVEPTLGVKQRNKWDIMWLPGMPATADPVEIGDRLRARVATKLQSRTALAPDPAPDPAPAGRTSIAQSTTVQASVAQLGAAGAGGITAVAALDGQAQIVALVILGVITLAAVWIMRERLKKWSRGIK